MGDVRTRVVAQWFTRGRREVNLLQVGGEGLPGHVYGQDCLRPGGRWVPRVGAQCG